MSIDVLWVEEEQRSLRYEMRLAEQQGWNITYVDTVSRAIELMNDTAFDLIVVDLILPLEEFHKQRGFVTPKAGIQLIESIRDSSRKGRTPQNVPLLVISAVVSPEQKAKVVKTLASDRYYLTKPLEEDTYRRVLMELTEKLDSSVHNL